MYKYTPVDGKWSLFDKDHQGKAVRFDRLGNMYYLGVDNCIYDS